MKQLFLNQKQRQELDVDLLLVSLFALGITIAIYFLLQPIRTSFIGVLLYDRGFTQYLAIFLASMVVAIIILKIIKLQIQSSYLPKNWISSQVSFADHKSPQLRSLWQELSREKSIITTRCSRILAAYINSGNRQAAIDFALDDSAFYLGASESSYTLPRVLIWAIPLLGFIGTVLGISMAVTGFSSFLEEAAEIDQLKEGISTVTSGLATAFDTTLLALSVSVLVMIPLVLVERWETRLLLSMDVYINDKLLARLPATKDKIDTTNIKETVNQAFQDNLPTAKDLVAPAHEYAQQAAGQLIETFGAEISKIQQFSWEIVAEINTIKQTALSDRQEFITVFEEQQKTNKEIVSNIRDIVKEIKHNNAAISTDIVTQTSQITKQLEQAAIALESRIIALEKCSTELGQITNLQDSLAKIVTSLEQTVFLEQVLTDIRENIALLIPALEQLGKPRKITLVEELETKERRQ